MSFLTENTKFMTVKGMRTLLAMYAGFKGQDKFKTLLLGYIIVLNTIWSILRKTARKLAQEYITYIK